MRCPQLYLLLYSTKQVLAHVTVVAIFVPCSQVREIQAALRSNAERKTQIEGKLLSRDARQGCCCLSPNTCWHFGHNC